VAVSAAGLSRRALLIGLGVAAGARAEAWPAATRPSLRPSLAPDGAAVAAAMAPSGTTAFCVIDLEDGAVLDALTPDRPMALASAAKALTAQFALERLGPAHRFATTLLADRAPADGAVDGAVGALTLRGGGDPTLDSAALAAMAAQAAEAGLRRTPLPVAADAGLVTPLIDAEQPAQAAYNPAVAALNLNFNRVWLRWRAQGRTLEAALEAHAEGWSPPAGAIALNLASRDCGCPPLAYTPQPDREGWTARPDTLRRQGGVWLPVRAPGAYAADVMTLALREAGVAAAPPASGPDASLPLARHDSPPLLEMAGRMMRYSTNLTAEALGLAAAGRPAGPPGPARLAEAARALNAWAAARAGIDGFAFTNFSGLSADSMAGCGAMARLLAALARDGQSAALASLMRDHRFDDRGAPGPEGASVSAKTGTLDFARALAGYAVTTSGRRLAFAFAANDLPRRSATPIPDGARPGARAWRNRAVRMERALLRHWLTRIG
jgi:D-alanyl-D-alanine carboxypeptidase/D-alanyl-D-alanine-endopeptidase (penicillin-binding protein 4)